MNLAFAKFCQEPIVIYIASLEVLQLNLFVFKANYVLQLTH